MIRRNWEEETSELVEKLEEEKVAKKSQEKLARGILNNTLLISAFSDIAQIINKSETEEAVKIKKVLDSYNREYDKLYSIGRKK